MLILERELNEAVIIEIAGRKVVIRVTEIGSVRCRLGVTAPKDMPVYRGEVQERINQQKRKSA